MIIDMGSVVVFVDLQHNLGEKFIWKAVDMTQNGFSVEACLDNECTNMDVLICFNGEPVK